jgi:hypothetical protein
VGALIVKESEQRAEALTPPAEHGIGSGLRTVGTSIALRITFSLRCCNYCLYLRTANVL